MYFTLLKHNNLKQFVLAHTHTHTRHTNTQQKIKKLYSSYMDIKTYLKGLQNVQATDDKHCRTHTTFVFTFYN